MQKEYKTNKLKPCICGYKPNHYTIGYGNTPMYVWCPKCEKRTKGIGGIVQNIIDYWNNEFRLIKL